MWPQSLLCSIIGWLHTWIKNEREPVVKAVADLSNEFLGLNFQVLSVDGGGSHSRDLVSDS